MNYIQEDIIILSLQKGKIEAAQDKVSTSKNILWSLEQKGYFIVI